MTDETPRDEQPAASTSPAETPSAPVAESGATSTAADKESARAAADRHGRRRVRQWLLTLLAALVVAAVGIGVATYFHARDVISSIPRNSHLMPTDKNRPPLPTGPMNFLILGADTRDYDPSDPGRSDTMMLAHVPEDRKHVYLVSITRDYWVPIHDRGYAKINAAYQEGGPALTVQTVEDLFGVGINHVALMDFQGFLKMTDALGGVQVWNEEEFTDSGDGKCHFDEGFVTIKGDCGLAYVRERKNAPNNDLGRAERQRAVVKAIAQKGLSAGALANPATANSMLSKIGDSFTLDSSFSDDDLARFATSLKLRSGDDIRSLQLPVGGYDVSDDGQDVNVPDREQLAELAQALRTDTMDQWWATHDPTVTFTDMPEWPVGQGLVPDGTPSPRPTVPTPTATPTPLPTSATPTKKR